jgi:hypothetical protein
MDEPQIASLQTLVEYYRNKCNKLEHDFVLYQAEAQRVIKELQHALEHSNESSSEEKSNEDKQPKG